MCGIAGFIGREKIGEGRILGTLGLMKNRGPDHQDYVTIADRGNFIAFLHSRLSIIDIDKRSDQPFVLGEYSLIFNGEIYNYLELRQHLLGRGIRLRTESDTEVLLWYYKLYGEKCVDFFEGMWSFAVYDKKNGKLFLSRDRFAEKPLYYICFPAGIYFASEVKFIEFLSGADLSVDTAQVLRYMVNGYKSLYKGGSTFFAGIREVPFASNLVVADDLSLEIRRYWEPACEPRQMTMQEAIDGFRHHLIESIKIRLRSDVPLAFCLSGGVDSGAITSIARKVLNYDVATFSIIDSDARYNEYDNLHATTRDLNCKHTTFDIPREGFFGRLKKLIEYHDAPVYTITYYIHSFLSEAISQGGYKVVVSGSAADEFVTGYYDHFNLYLYQMRNSPDYNLYINDWEAKVKKFVRNPYLQNPRIYFDNPDFRGHIYMNQDIFAGLLKKDFKESFTEVRYCNSLLRNRMLNELFHETIPPILHEDDLNSMFYSIENRSPFLDSKLFKFAYSVPEEYLIQDGYGKFILRQAVKGTLNEKVRTYRQKKGFNASINSLIDFKKKENRDFFLEDGKIFDFVERDRFEDFFRGPEDTNDFSKFLFYFLNAKIFLEING